MELSKDDVQQLAALARLELTEAEVTRYQQNLGAILEHVERLRTYMNDKDVTVDRRVVTDVNELRPDEPSHPRSSEERAELLAGTRAIRDDKVVVPGVFGGES